MDLNNLNPEQRRAAETLNGPVLILAGAGSGKTRTVTYRIANLIDHGVKPWNILALTFTNKAAREMSARIEKLVGADTREMWMGTFHSVCTRILRRDIEKIGYKRNFTIYDDDDQTRVIKNVAKSLNLNDEKMIVKEIRAAISDSKNKMLSNDEWFAASLRDRHCQQIHDALNAYEETLKKANALDFDDLILCTIRLFAEHPPVLEFYQRKFQYIHVDEYQDTNTAQYELIHALTGPEHNLCVVGDDDQSIYGWRGADIRNILDFEKDYPETTVIRLEQNYRSTANILDAANQVIAHNRDRKDKTLWTEAGEGEKIHLFGAEDERDEAAWICDRVRTLEKKGDSYHEMAVLYRMHSQSRVIEEMFVRAGIPYRVFGGTRFYDRKEVRDALAYMRVIANPADDISLMRIINEPKRSIGESTVEMLEEQAKAENVPLYSVVNDPPETLSARPRKCISDFAALLLNLLAEKEFMPLGQFAEKVLDETGLLAQYDLPGNEEAQMRKENLMEFVGAANEFERANPGASVEDFLENVSLITDLDRQEDAPKYVTLMTLHSVKGLEYDNVFMAGMEDGLFPSARSKLDPSRLEEERRLCYVGITRARKRLFISYARRRMIFNQITHNPPSPFLSEIPSRLIEDRLGDTIRSSFEQTRPGLPQRRDRMRNTDFGTPGMPPASEGLPLSIPGVRKGFAPLPASGRRNRPEDFRPGDRVLHRKFGEGTVVAVTGAGPDARISVSFTAYGTREFSLAIAPIVKM